MNTTLFATDFHGNDPKFTYYLLKTLPLAEYNSGSVQPSLNRNFIKSIPVSLPPPDEQRRIAGALSAFDEKRESNSRLARLLGRTAQVSFRRLFANKIEGPHRLGDFVTVTRGRSYKSAELADSDTALLTLKSVRPGGGYSGAGLKPYTGKFKPEQVVRPGELIVAHTDLTQQAAVIGKPAIVSSRGAYAELVASLDLAVVRPASEKLSVPFLYHLFLEPAFQQHAYGFANGSTVLHLNKEAIPSFSFDLPDNDSLEAYDAVAGVLLEKTRSLEIESQTLEAARDALLPKLISGEIRVTGTGHLAGSTAPTATGAGA